MDMTKLTSAQSTGDRANVPSEEVKYYIEIRYNTPSTNVWFVGNKFTADNFDHCSTKGNALILTSAVAVDETLHHVHHYLTSPSQKSTDNYELRVVEERTVLQYIGAVHIAESYFQHSLDTSR